MNAKTMESFRLDLPKSSRTGFENIQQQQAKRIFEEVEFLYQCLPSPDKPSPSTLLGWLQLFTELTHTDHQAALENHLLPEKKRYREKRLYYASLSMLFASLTFSVVGLGLTGLGNLLLHNRLATEIGSGLNDSCALSYTPLALLQRMQGENFLARLNVLTTTLSTTYDVTTALADYSSVLSLSSIATGVLGFTPAVISSINCGVELYKMRRQQRQIDHWQQRLTRLEAFTDVQAQHQQAVLKKAVLITKAQQADTRKNAQLYGISAMASTAVAIAGVIVVSTMTFGAFPLVIAAVSFFATLVLNMAQGWHIRKNPHLTMAKASLTIPPGTDCLYDRLQKAIDHNSLNLDFKKSVRIRSHGFFTQRLTLQSYLNDLALKDSHKLQKIVTALEEADRAQFEQALADKRHPKIPGASVGLKIYRQLCPATPIDQAPLLPQKSPCLAHE